MLDTSQIDEISSHLTDFIEINLCLDLKILESLYNFGFLTGNTT